MNTGFSINGYKSYMIYIYKGDGSRKDLSKVAWSWCGSIPQGSDWVTLLAHEYSGSSLGVVESLGEPGHIEGR
jgi:hypothetical protein